MQRTKLIALISWGLIAGSSFLYYITHPTIFEPQNFAELLKNQTNNILIIYTLLCFLRAFTLIPNTFLVMVGTILFPTQFLLVFLISFTEILFSATLIYHFSDFLGLDELFEKKYLKRIQWLKTQIQERGMWIIIGWCAFPFVPTDIIFYTAGTLKMNFLKFITATAIITAPLVILYMFLGEQLGKLFGV